MTRASLLRILDNLGGISETEVQELEQLAATFPYCQTAHLLLAKAAHDRGSMLAAQRLRRAATYAVDRQRLRALIELPAPLPPVEFGAAGNALPTEITKVAPENAPQPALAVAAAEPMQAEVIASMNPTDSESADNQSLGTVGLTLLPHSPEMPPGPANGAEEKAEAPSFQEVLPETSAENAPQPDSAEIVVVGAAETDESGAASIEPMKSGFQPATAVITTEEQNAAPEAEAILARQAMGAAAEVKVESEFGPATTAGATPDQSAADLPEAASEAMTSPGPAEVETEVVLALTEVPGGASDELPETTAAPADPELPPAALPIRLPAEVGSSRFEFGLAAPTPAAIPNYNLFDAEKVAAKPAGIPPFWADEELGYAPGLGSRLGFCLQAHDEYSLDLPPSAFFAPDALLLHHLHQHQPTPVPTSIDLIDKFLRSKPRFKAPLPLPPTTEAQADLSVRSTVAEPSLASESLARILVRQGKIAKAIEIYERLMVRQPEKKAYFADQIQQLQTFE